MRKQLIFLCTLAAVATACNVKESVLNSENSDLRIVTVTATCESFPDSKSYYDDSGTFSWAENDAIVVLTYSQDSERHDFYPMQIATGAGGNTATFSGTISGQLTGLAVYPYLDTLPQYDDNNRALTVYLPAKYNWVDQVAYNPMVSLSSEDEASSINFKNLGALFKVTLNNVPNDATKVVFTTGKRISGYFAVNNLTNTVSNEWEAGNAAYIETDDSDEGVTFTFTALQEPTDMVFYVPVPVGTYPYIGFDVKDENDQILWAFRGQREQEMPRNQLMIMEPLEYPDDDILIEDPPGKDDAVEKDNDDDSGDSGDSGGDGSGDTES